MAKVNSHDTVCVAERESRCESRCESRRDSARTATRGWGKFHGLVVGWLLLCAVAVAAQTVATDPPKGQPNDEKGTQAAPSPKEDPVAGEADLDEADLDEADLDEADLDEGDADSKLTGELEFRLETVRGRIVWFGEALQRRWGIRTVPEFKERVLALETKDGQLIALLEDIRGRAFRVDERLRNLADCELLVRRYPGVPAVKIVKVFSHEHGKKVELDYWCEICAITMFELKACDCCQGDIELRRRTVK